MLLEDWYPDLGTRYMQDSKGDYLVTRLAPCNECTEIAFKRLNKKLITASKSQNKIKNTKAGEDTTYTMHINNSYSFNDPFQMPLSTSESVDIEKLRIEEIRRNEKSDNDNYEENEENDKESNIVSKLLADLLSDNNLKQFDFTPWIYCFLLDNVCYSVLKNDTKVLTCPKHGNQLPHLIAPDIAFEDMEEKHLIKCSDSLKIETLLGRGSFGSVFCGSLIFKENENGDQRNVRVAVKMLESSVTSSKFDLNLQQESKKHSNEMVFNFFYF